MDAAEHNSSPESVVPGSFWPDGPCYNDGIEKIHGKTSGLRPHQLKRLSNLYRRKIPPQAPVTADLARALTELSAALGRGISLLIDRRGRIREVAVGDARDTPVPGVFGETQTRLQGVRLVHTHLKPGGLSDDDLSVLFLNRLDAVIAVDVLPQDGRGLPGPAQLATIAPPTSSQKNWIVEDPLSVHDLENEDFEERMRALEEELARARSAREVQRRSEERALLVGLRTDESQAEAESRLEELRELARSAGAEIASSDLQYRPQPDPRTLIGRGKLRELVSVAYHEDADLLIFDRELSPGQAREIEKTTNLKVLDRTQLILDIFARNASGHEAQVQVELAQLQYQLPRLAGRGTAMSRLGAGIGTRGPGETKLEVDRRRIRDRIRALEGIVADISRRRSETRKQRTSSPVPVVALVGYTNAGKSSLFNSLAREQAVARPRLFATLRPTTREAWLPQLGEWGARILLTDTVGFIRDLPEELVNAFRATLEELHYSDLLLHVVDAATPGVPERVEAVNRILDELELERPRVIVLNKADITPADELAGLRERYSATAVSALTGDGLDALRERLADILEPSGSRAEKVRAA